MAVSTLSKDILVKTYSVTTVTNSQVSPFGAYVDSTVPQIQGYTPMFIILEGLGSTNPSSARMFGATGVFVWTKTAATINVRVLYIKN
jgi:hypothetical protein